MIFSYRFIKKVSSAVLLSFFILVFLSCFGGHTGLCQTPASNKQEQSECNHCHHEETTACHDEDPEHLHDTFTLKFRPDEAEGISQTAFVCLFKHFSNADEKNFAKDRPPDMSKCLILHRTIVLLI